MLLVSFFLLHLHLLTLTSALPTAPIFSRACGTTLFPTLYTLQESSPGAPSPLNPPFTTSQTISNTGTIFNRTFTLAHFTSPLLTGTYGCTLHLLIPATTPVSTHGSSTVNIKSISWLAATAFFPTWNSITPSLAIAGTFGTVNVASGIDAYVNSGTCPPTGSTTGLAFVFETPDWVSVGAGVQFAEGPGVGPYLTFGC